MKLGRYEAVARLGRGGMGEVWRVRDATLGRTVAMKIGQGEAFEREARMTAALQHPGIVPILELGTLDDGRGYYTMPEVRGRTLGALLAAGDAGLRRLVDVFHRACEAVAYAHGEGVVHCDLNPSNIMVGPFGEVLVLDWGLAEKIGADRGVSGTLLWMAPEQARGETVRPQADVYALGAVLRAILTGRELFPSMGAAEILAELRAGRVPTFPHDVRAPDELVAACAEAMLADAGLRPPDAGALAASVRDWLEGVGRRERATLLMTQAEARVATAEELRKYASLLRKDADRALADVPPHAPEEEKHTGWELEDRAAALEHRAAEEEFAREVQLGAALEQAPDLDEARALLAEHARARLIEAEERRSLREAARYGAWLAADPWKRHESFLRGDGTITLLTDRPARVTLFRLVEWQRRILPRPEGTLGRTPLRDVPLGRGAWLLWLDAPGCHGVRYPVRLARGERWDGIAPGEETPRVVTLPPLGTLGDEDCYVPCGWFPAGGDPDAPDGLSARRVWTDGFVMRRFPVRNAEYLAFLGDLPDEEAEARVPRSVDGTQRPYIREGGRWVLGRDDSGRRWAEDEPVVLVSWEDAVAFAAWRARRDGLPWRLPHDLEWEKAARGVDGRRFPWGDRFDPSRTAMVASQAGAPHLRAVTAVPSDESPYGVRGMAGNVRDWCANGYARGGDVPAGGRVSLASEAAALRMVRGGSAHSTETFCRAALRMAAAGDARMFGVGFRLVRSLG